MLFDIELSKEEVLELEHLLESRTVLIELMDSTTRQNTRILLQKVKFMKLQIQGHGLEAAANLLHLKEVPDYAPERADVWHGIAEGLEKGAQMNELDDSLSEWFTATPSV